MFVIPLYYKNSYQTIYLNTSALFLFLQISLSVCLLQCSSCLCGDSPGYSCFWIEEETLMKNSINIYITKLSQMQNNVLLLELVLIPFQFFQEIWFSRFLMK